MRFRKLRIAWSVGWGIACVLLIVLWVRSYWYKDTVMAILYRENCSGAIRNVGHLSLGHNGLGDWNYRMCRSK